MSWQRGPNLDDYSDVELLALLIAGEADGEDLPGKVAVACVPITRLERRRWGDSLRVVILQPYQFSTFNAGHWMAFVPRMGEYRRLAALAMEKLLNSPVNGATHYHAASMIVRPKWAHSPQMQVMAQVGNHVFYREE
jgi:spore germination cell wall hydrolase CwlJ-like protein